jgi:nicotinate-nucleotide adenylyltransferase
MNIAILGGSFDPPHIWHFWTAQQVLENAKEIDQVWLLPDYSNAFKQVIAEASDRLEMLKFFEAGRIKVSSVAVSRSSTAYTVEIVQELLRDDTNRYFWIVGSDILYEFSRWREYQKLTRLIKFLVIPRKDYPIKNLPAGFIRVEGNLMLSNVSSTLIRERIRKGLPIKGLVFPEVEEYIKEHNLYK